MQAINVALAVVTGTASKKFTGILRRGVLEAFLFDPIIHDVLLQLLAVGPTLEVGFAASLAVMVILKKTPSSDPQFENRLCKCIALGIIGLVGLF